MRIRIIRAFSSHDRQQEAFISLAKPWKPEEWKNGGKAHFLDLRTLAWVTCPHLQSRDNETFSGFWVSDATFVTTFS